MDDLQIYFGSDLIINERISVRQPTLREMISIGEEEYFGLVYAATAISSDMKSMLWDAGVDWTEFSDLETFYLMMSGMTRDKTAVLFGDLDFTQFGLYKRDDGDLLMLSKDGVVIDMYIHKRIHEFLCKVHGIKKQPEFAGNKLTKMVMIEDDRQRIKKGAAKTYESYMLPLISAMVNSEGFKYNLETVQDLKLYAFMDSVRRIQTIKSADHLTDAYYSGNLDVDKFDTSKLDWLCDYNKKNKH